MAQPILTFYSRDGSVHSITLSDLRAVQALKASERERLGLRWVTDLEPRPYDLAQLDALLEALTARLREQQKDIPADKGAPRQGGGKPMSATALETLIGSEKGAVMEVLMSGGSVDTKMRGVCRVDCQFVLWNSCQWARLLEVSDAAVRSTRFWRQDRKRAIEALQ